MVNVALIWYLMALVMLSVITIILIFMFDSQRPVESSIKFGGGGLIVAALAISMAFYMGKGVKTADSEIWNGQVISKSRVHGTYTRSYSCELVLG